jgi:DNA repair protein RadA/Sms
MARAKPNYACAECGAQLGKWTGQCPDCGAWNSIEEVPAAPVAVRRARPGGYTGQEASEVVRLQQVDVAPEMRSSCASAELDRVLGGGLVSGSVVLLGGDPGIGKSTLLLQSTAAMSAQMPVLYVTGEESPQQVALRARRLGLSGDVRLLSETGIDPILTAVARERPQIVVIDSIQTVYSEQLASAPGTVGQVRESAAVLVRLAKQTGTSIFLVGHVTKEGTLAGPRVLEHMVDTVLYFEGDASSRYRVIRSVKNRFGPVNEIGVFAMTDRGLRDVSNPSAIFLSRHGDPVPGSVVMVTREGSRPLLVEVQALVDESHGSSPRRVTVGLEQNRLAMLLAVLHRHGGVASYDQDVFLNVVGGVRVTETAADLPALLAILSSLRNRPLPQDLVVFGEVGLSGEVRPVPGGTERLQDAAKHGFHRALVPRANAPRRDSASGIECTAVDRVADALAVI